MRHLSTMLVLLALGFVLLPITGLAEEEKAYVAVVKGDDVNVRIGASRNYPAVLQVDEGNEIEVRGEAHGWCKVRPRETVSLYISRKYVELRDGGIGVVTGDRVNVRPEPVVNGYWLGTVSEGEVLRVVDATDPDWLTIDLPPSLHLWMHKDYLTYLRDLPSETAEGESDDSESVQATTETDGEEEANPAAILLLAEKAYRAELEKPMAEMNFAEARRQFEQVKKLAGSKSMKKAAEKGLERIDWIEKLRHDYQKRLQRLEKAFK